MGSGHAHGAKKYGQVVAMEPSAMMFNEHEYLHLPGMYRSGL